MATKKVTLVAKSQNPFLLNALAESNKTEKDVLTEKVQEFLSNAIIDCKQQIAEREISIRPRKLLELQKAENEVEKANKNYLKVKTSIPSNGHFQTYFNNLTAAEVTISESNYTIDCLIDQLRVIDLEILKLNRVLADLSI